MESHIPHVVERGVACCKHRASLVVGVWHATCKYTREGTHTMTSLHLMRSSDAVTVSINNPEPIVPMRTVEHLGLVTNDDELTIDELEDYYR